MVIFGIYLWLYCSSPGGQLAHFSDEFMVYCYESLVQMQQRFPHFFKSKEPAGQMKTNFDHLATVEHFANQLFKAHSLHLTKLLDPMYVLSSRFLVKYEGSFKIYPNPTSFRSSCRSGSGSIMIFCVIWSIFLENQFFKIQTFSRFT